MKLIDLSQTIAPGMPLFSPQAPQPTVSAWMSHEQAAASGHYQGCTCEISEVHLLTSIGTYLDSPYHFHPNADSIEKLPLEKLVLPGIVVDCTGVGPREPIGPESLDGLEVAGKAVLFHTGWSRYWGAPEYDEFPYLTGETAHALLARGARLAGVDFLVIDNTRDPRRPVHVTLLEAGILIVENLTNLFMIPETGFTFHAVPAKVAGAAAFPVRAYAIIADNQT